MRGDIELMGGPPSPPPLGKTLLGDPKKYSCLINRKMHNKKGILKLKQF